MRLLILSAAFLVAACASGGGDDVAPAAPAPPPPQASAPMTQAPLQSAASGVTLPAEPAPAPRGDEDLTVPGGRDIPVPSGTDPRTNEQRMAHVRAWDTCVMRLQNQAEDNPTRPALNTPEDVCSRQLGMAGRMSIPDSFRR